MASCSGLQQIFENPLPEKPTLMESLSWNQIKSMKSIDHSSSAPSFTEIFGELHFQEVIKPLQSSFLNHDDCNSEKKKNKKNLSSPSPSTSSSSTFLKSSSGATSTDAFSSKNLESLQLCTEGLGFESFDDVEELKNEVSCRDNWDDDDEEDDGHKERIISIMKHSSSSSSSNDQNYMHDKSRFTCSRKFPPPISCIGRSGKPWICFKSYRQDGRFVLKEFRIPTQEFLHACREDGRLRLHLVQPDPEQEQEQEECKEEQEQEECKEEQEQEFVEQNEGNDAHDADQEHRDETEELPIS